MSIMRNLDGFSTVDAAHPLRAIPFLDPTRWAVWFDDYLAYDKTQGNAAYTLTNTNGVDTILGPTGILTITLGGADNDLAQVYLTDGAFATVAGKKLVWEARVKVNKGAGGTIGQEEVFVGLSSVQTGTNFMDAGGLIRTMNESMGFLSFDATANVNCIQGQADSVSTEAAAFAYADDTWMVLGCYYDGVQTYFYKDDVLEATLTDNEPTSVVTPMLYIKAGAGHAKILSADYFLVATER